MLKKLLKVDIDQISLDHDGTICAVNEISAKDIAIIGMSCKFGSANNIEEFWRGIKYGKDFITSIPENRRMDTTNYLKYAKYNADELHYADIAYLDEIDKFDCDFFKISPKEAGLMDPNQRLFLQTAWHAIEDAGLGGKKLYGSKTGVFVGFGDQYLPYRRLIETVEPSQLAASVPGNLEPVIASRLSYLMDFKGTSMVVNTACSSSLIAVYLACREIRSGTCDMAIAGGVNIILAPLQNGPKLGIESSDGRTKTFDDSSDGTGSGEGVAAVLLKPLSKALRDGDNIYAIIKGISTNSDGSSNGITAPNPAAQEAVIVQAWEDAGVDPETISYIECHGTGTKLGDPIEIEGIKRAFKRYTTKKQFCAVGSVKTNIGHLDGAAGIAGLVKAALSLKHGVLPPSLHFKYPNRSIDFEDSPVYVNDILKNWKTEGYPRRCGVSSFGLSGTNCHIVLEEAPKIKSTHNSEECQKQILSLSAKSKAALSEIVENYKKVLDSETDYKLEDICYTANTGRGHYSHRLALLLDSIGDFRLKLDLLDKSGLADNVNPDIYYGEHKKISYKGQSVKAGEITDEKAAALSRAAEIKLKEFLESGENDTNLLREICMLYVKGGEIEWDELYRGNKRNRISLPVYPFKDTRCWLETADLSEHDEEVNSQNNIFYSLKWKPEETTGNKDMPKGTVLAFINEDNKCKQIIGQLKADGRNIIKATLGTEFKKLNDNCYMINDSQESYERLLDEIKNVDLTQIIHLMTINQSKEIKSVQELEKSQRMGVYSLFYLAKAMLNNKIENNIDLVLVSEYVNEVTGREIRINPENATMFGLGKVIPKESTHIKVRSIDIDDFSSINSVIDELEMSPDKYQVAYREGKRYVEELEERDISKIQRKKITIKPDGAYIVAGGTGGLGLETAKFLAAGGNINIALISRKGIPARNKWEEILSAGKDAKMCAEIQSVKEIEKKGAAVVCYSAELSNYDRMKEVVNELHSRFGKINGIIHSAGMAGDGFIVNKDEEVFNRVLYPKVYGTWVLDTLTREDNPDFFVMYSSVETLTGDAGQGDYTAANSYQNAFAAFRDKHGRNTQSINWSAWENTGMAADYSINPNSVFAAMPKRTAIKAFDEILHKDIQRVYVFKPNYNKLNSENLLFDLSAEIKNKARKSAFENRKDIGVNAGNNFENEFRKVNVIIKGNKFDDYTKTEKLLAKIYANVMGYNEINILDDFYELGGDSLIAMRIVQAINKETNIKLEIADLFNHLTIKDFAAFLDKKSVGPNVKGTFYTAIERAPEMDCYPLTSAQKRLLPLCQIENIGIAFNMPRVIIIDGQLEQDRLNGAFLELIKRYDVLRTSFEIRNGEFVQVIHKKIDFQMQCIEADESELNKIAKQFIQMFDLSKAPLLRAALVTFSNYRHALIYDMHHLISDGTSMEFIFDELLKLYNGQKLPETGLQFKDYAVWQQNRYRSNLIETQKKYWTDLFCKGVPTLNIPIDFKRKKKPDFTISTLKSIVSGENLSSLNTFAAKQNLTLNIICFTLYSILLSKFCSQNDIVIGIVIAGRDHADIQKVIGDFAYTIPVKIKIDKDKTLLETLYLAKQVLLDAYKFQDYPFEELANPAIADKDPIMETFLNFHNEERQDSAVEIGGLKFSEFEFNLNVTNLDFRVNIFLSDSQMTIKLDYNISLFRKEKMQNLLNNYSALICNLAMNLNKKISEIRLMDD